MSNGPRIVKPVKEMTRKEELVSKLTNKHAQARATQEWQALVELAKMDGTTVTEAFAQVRDVVGMRQVLALEAIAGELHGINQGLANLNVLQEMLHPELFEKEEAPAAEGQSETAEDPELPDDPVEKVLAEEAADGGGAQQGAQVEP